MPPHTVLRFLGVYEDISPFIFNCKHGKHSMRSRKPLPDHGTRYAKLVSFANSASGDVVFVPITETGR